MSGNYTAYIDGGFVRPRGGATFDAVNPATGDHLAEIARCGAADVAAAVEAARRALPAWKATSYETRAALTAHPHVAKPARRSSRSCSSTAMREFAGARPASIHRPSDRAPHGDFLSRQTPLIGA
ncbi:betaine-aldehyde dehydrogenase [Burkholderia paludis]|uniref:Betaine-aldehyde dehydrogenase n=2 Tax=Burkholderia paludis TaxID=1506587 RepID=A0A6J5DZU2_9BURK|nr:MULTISPECIES: aldehyde dehydrogenase family protein [Burkholderia]CAB3759679.1 NAD/NADP-dependent betaine aldehyde dehydrogenase [Burkholderia paludis]VWB56309.1 betaine-aldehyde dehydrogenase [Burkholderia paludis]